MNYFFHPAAEAEHLESIAYYESKRPGLGATYLAEFEQLITVICEVPHRFPIEKQPDVRRIVMQKFPFAILYREFLNSVQILAIAHHRRRPQYWLGRF
jgi:plasmid stabilization system protein ParE